MNRAEKRRQHKLAKRAPKKQRYAKTPKTASNQEGWDVTNLLTLGIQNHKLSSFSEAEKFYKRVLVADPSQPVALHLLGAIRHQCGENAFAEELISKALMVKPGYAEAHNSLGLVL